MVEALASAVAMSLVMVLVVSTVMSWTLVLSLFLIIMASMAVVILLAVLVIVSTKAVGSSVVGCKFVKSLIGLSRSVLFSAMSSSGLVGRAVVMALMMMSVSSTPPRDRVTGVRGGLMSSSTCKAKGEAAARKVDGVPSMGGTSVSGCCARCEGVDEDAGSTCCGNRGCNGGEGEGAAWMGEVAAGVDGEVMLTGAGAV